MESYRTIKIGKIKTSKTELVDIVKAWVVLSLAFALVLSGVRLLNLPSISNLFSINFLMSFGISLLTVGIGFLFHELAHKFTAQYYGCMAEFRADNKMLYLALGLAALVGFIFAAPGAVMIAGRVTHKENGIISLAGPLTNFVLGVIFLGLSFLILYWSSILFFGFTINMVLGLFNLIPLGPLDGKKILLWNRYVWLTTVCVGVFLSWYFKICIFGLFC